MSSQRSTTARAAARTSSDAPFSTAARASRRNGGKAATRPLLDARRPQPLGLLRQRADGAREGLQITARPVFEEPVRPATKLGDLLVGQLRLTTIPCSQGTPSSRCGILPGELAVSCGRSSRSAARRRAAPMQEISEQRTTALEAPGVPADAALAERWAGEPFLRPDEDPAEVLAPGTARRRALDEALAEIAAGREEPSYEWRTKIRAHARARARAHGQAARPRVRHGATPAPGRRSRRACSPPSSRRTSASSKRRTASTSLSRRATTRTAISTATWRTTARSTRPATRRSPSARIPAPSAATASAIPRPRGRRSPPPGSWRQPARPACSSSRTAGCSSASSSGS